MGLFNLTNHFSELSSNTQAYVKSMLEYYKLDSYKKTTKIISMLVKVILLGSLLMLFLAFASVSCAFLIGNAIESYTLGFLLVGGFYLLIFFILFIFRKSIIDNLIIRKTYSLYFQNEKQEEVLDNPLDNQTVVNSEKN